jgi:hypothetical protein
MIARKLTVSVTLRRVGQWRLVCRYVGCVWVCIIYFTSWHRCINFCAQLQRLICECTYVRGVVGQFLVRVPSHQMAKVFLDFIGGLDAHVRAQCWSGHPLTALLTLRMLDVVQQQLVMRLLFGEQGLAGSVLVDTGIVTLGVRECLTLEGVIASYTNNPYTNNPQNTPGMYALQSEFSAALRQGLTNPDPLDWGGAVLAQMSTGRVEEESEQVRHSACVCVLVLVLFVVYVFVHSDGKVCFNLLVTQMASLESANSSWISERNALSKGST